MACRLDRATHGNFTKELFLWVTSEKGTPWKHCHFNHWLSCFKMLIFRSNFFNVMNVINVFFDPFTHKEDEYSPVDCRTKLTQMLWMYFQLEHSSTTKVFCIFLTERRAHMCAVLFQLFCCWQQKLFLQTLLLKRFKNSFCLHFKCQALLQKNIFLKLWGILMRKSDS